MKIVINQKDLSKAINTVQKAVSNKSPMPILSGILLEAYNDKLVCTATDLELGINTFVDCEIIEEGSVVVNAKLIGEFVRKLPINSDVNLTVDENKNVYVKCENSDFKVLGNSSEEYPDNTFNNDGVTFKINSNTLKSLIKYTVFATSTEQTKPIFTGCLIDIEGSSCTFVALDGYRMALKKDVIESNEIVQAVVPAKTLNEVARILEENECEIEVIVSKSHISFVFGNTTIISKLLEGKFLDYKNFIKEEYETKISLNANEFKNSLDRASLLLKDDSYNLIILDIMDDKMEIKSSSEYGNCEEIVILKSKDGDNLKLGFNSKYINDVIKVIDSEDIEIKFLGAVSPCFISEINNDNFIYMLLPVRCS